MSVDRITRIQGFSQPDVGRLESICDRFEDAWRDGDQPVLEDFLKTEAVSPDLFRELIVLDAAYRMRSGESPRAEEYQARFPGHETTIQDALEAVRDGKEPSTILGGAPGSDGLADVTTSFGGPDHGADVGKHVAEVLSHAGYEITDELGRGGMGIVYEARQTALGRIVALKVLKAGLFATDEECRRFLNEAEAVAKLDHPAIVPIHEVRRCRGLYFYSMRRVSGLSLDQKLKDGPLIPADAARLVVHIAGAVDYAHRHGILHRDIKPANILVDDAGTPFLTDFGLARRLDANGEDATRTGAVLGTPSYMSPEQVEGRISDLTTATDIFGLGGVLYAALTGRSPHPGSSVAETLDLVRKVPPEPPSRLNRLVSRDLESVCLKCLEKDPLRRYGSARDLADDIKRWLDGKPTLARPVSRVSRVRMWVRRHPVPAALVSALAAAILVGLFASGWQWREANRHRIHAERIFDYLSNRVLGQASTDVNPHGANITVRELLDLQAARIGGDFQDDPEIETALRETFGNTYHSLGLFNDSETQLRRALKLSEQSGSPDSLESIRIATRLGRVISENRSLAQGEQLLSQTRTKALQSLGPVHPITLEATARLGANYLAQNRVDEAEPLLRQVLETRRRILPMDHPDTLQSVNDLCRLAVETSRLGEAEPLAFEYERGIRCARGGDHPDNVTALSTQAKIRRLQGKLAEAVTLHEKAAVEAKRILGPKHPTTISADRAYALLLQESKKP